MKNIVLIVLLFFSVQLYSQTSNPLKPSKKEALTAIDILKYGCVPDISQNPGFTGVMEKKVLRTHFNSMWLNMHKFPYSIMVSYDQPMGKENKYGIGILVNRYQFNTIKQYVVDFTFSAKFRLNAHNTLRWGISAISINKNDQNSSRTGRVYEDMISPFYGPLNPTFERKVVYKENYFDLKTGVWLSHKNYFAGLSILHIAQIQFGNQNQVETSESKNSARLPVELILNAGYEFKLGKSLLFTPIILVDGKLNLPIAFSPSANFTINKTLLVGFSYQNLNIAALNVGICLQNHLNIIVTAGMPVKEELQRISKLGLLETGISYLF